MDVMGHAPALVSRRVEKDVARLTGLQAAWSRLLRSGHRTALRCPPESTHDQSNLAWVDESRECGCV